MTNAIHISYRIIVYMHTLFINLLWGYSSASVDYYCMPGTVLNPFIHISLSSIQQQHEVSIFFSSICS